MSLVGPRPCLYSQDQLIDARDKFKVFDVLPGITGLSQVSGIDMYRPDAVRLFSSLIVDSSKARDLLDWHPVTTIDEKLCKISPNEKSI